MAENPTQREAVQNLQRYLRRLSYENNDILPVPVDGIFDTQTEAALSEFQKMNGLPVTGVADAETWNRLFEEYTRLRIEDDRHVPLDFFPSVPEHYEPVDGERHAFISLLQFMLGELSLVYDAYAVPTVNGMYDTETAEAVAVFQKIQGLPPTGRLNRHTWNRLSEEYRNYLMQHRL